MKFISEISYTNYYTNNKKILIPFELPINWKWCKLSYIATKLVDGNHNPPKGLIGTTNYLMLSSQNIEDGRFTKMSDVRYLSYEQFIVENKRTDLDHNDILFTNVGTLGRSLVYTQNLNICFQRSVSVIHTLINPCYLKFVFDSPYYQNNILKNATGTAQKGFYLNQLANSLIPVPPLSMQNKIACAVNFILEKINV